MLRLRVDYVSATESTLREHMLPHSCAQSQAIISHGLLILKERSGGLRVSHNCFRKLYAALLAHQPLWTLRRIYDWCDSCNLKDLLCKLYYHGATTAHSVLILQTTHSSGCHGCASDQVILVQHFLPVIPEVLGKTAAPRHARYGLQQGNKAVHTLG